MSGLPAGGDVAPGGGALGDALPRVEVPGFAGPLPELLAAVEVGEVDPASVPVAAVGRQVVEGLPLAGSVPPEAELEIMSRSLVLLARLLAVKARAVAPGGPGASDAEAEEEAGEDGGHPGTALGETETAGADAIAGLEELAERLAACSAFRQAAEELRRLEVLQGERFPGRAEVPGGASPTLAPLRPEELVAALAAVWERAPAVATVPREPVTVARRMEEIARLLARAGRALSFWELFPPGAGRREVVVTFLALLELMRLRRARVWQEAEGGEILVEGRGEGGGGGGGTPGGGRQDGNRR